MKVKRSHLPRGIVRAPLPLSIPPEQSEEDLRRLGEALQTRVDEVLELTLARTAEASHEVDATVQSSLERISRNATAAVARWIAGESMEVAIEAGREIWEIFGELAFHRAALLNEVTWRCFWWRNVMAEVLQESAAQLDVSPEATSHAMNLLQLSLEFNLLRMCECFEAERQRTDEELARREAELAFLATHDALTGLPNRSLVMTRTEEMLERSHLCKKPAAALFVDLDNFKKVNDTLGHAVGDELLQAVAARLEGALRETDVLGRLGGDEFVVLSEEVPPTAGPVSIAQDLLEVLERPFKLGHGNETAVTMTASIGIALAKRSSAETLLRDADSAMYRAKREGKGRYAILDKEETAAGIA